MRAEDILPDTNSHVEQNGVVIRKGSVGAFLVNARVWSDPQSSLKDKETAERDIIDALPALHALGLLDVLDIADPALKAFVAAH